MGTLQALVDAPAIVAVAAMFASRCTGELDDTEQAYVMRALPPALHDRLVAHPEADFINVLPALGKRRRPVFEKRMRALDTSEVASVALRDAVARRDEEIRHSMIMREPTIGGQQVTGSAADMLPSILRDRLKLLDEADDLVRTWLRVRPPTPARLNRMTWDQARAAAAAWEKNSEAQNELRVPSLDGWHWRRLHSVRSLEREGLALKHCVGNGDYDHEAQVPVVEGGFWSLRDADGKSVMTLRLKNWGDGLEIYNFLGLCNRTLGADDIRHLPALRAYYAGLGIALTPKMLQATERTEVEVVEIDGHEVQAWDVFHHDENGLVRVDHVTFDVTAEREERRRDHERMRAAVEEANRQRPDALALPCGPAFYRALRENEAARHAYWIFHDEVPARREPDAVVTGRFQPHGYTVAQAMREGTIELRSAPVEGSFRAIRGVLSPIDWANDYGVPYDRPDPAGLAWHRAERFRKPVTFAPCTPREPEGNQALVPDNVAYLVPELPDGQMYNATFSWTGDAVERHPTRAERAAARPHWQQLNEQHQRRTRR